VSSPIVYLLMLVSRADPQIDFLESTCIHGLAVRDDALFFGFQGGYQRFELALLPSPHDGSRTTCLQEAAGRGFF